MTATAEKKPTATPASKKPALIAFHVAPGPKGQQTIPTPIGAAWEHPDGKGYTLQLHLVPASGGQIVLRVPNQREDGKARKAPQKPS